MTAHNLGRFGLLPPVQLQVAEDALDQPGQELRKLLSHPEVPLGNTGVECGFRDARDSIALTVEQPQEHLPLERRLVVERREFPPHPGEMTEAQVHHREQSFDWLDRDWLPEFDQPLLCFDAHGVRFVVLRITQVKSAPSHAGM